MELKQGEILSWAEAGKFFFFLDIFYLTSWLSLLIPVYECIRLPACCKHAFLYCPSPGGNGTIEAMMGF